MTEHICPHKYLVARVGGRGGPLIMEAGCCLAGWSGSRVHDAAVKVSPGAGSTPKHIGTDVKRIYILAGCCTRT